MDSTLTELSVNAKGMSENQWLDSLWLRTTIGEIRLLLVLAVHLKIMSVYRVD